MCKKPRRQPFHIEATKLNFKACPIEGYSEVLRTEMLDYALTYVARIHCSDDELRAMEGTPECKVRMARGGVNSLFKNLQATLNNHVSIKDG
jgi:hypothetical protein